MGWGGREVQEGGDIWLIQVDVWQKTTQYCKAITLQFKINKFNYKKKIDPQTQNTNLWLQKGKRIGREFGNKIGSLGLKYTHYYIQNRSITRIYSILQGTLCNIL